MARFLVPFPELGATAAIWNCKVREGYALPGERHGNSPSALTETARELGDVALANAAETIRNRLDMAVCLGLHVEAWRAQDTDRAADVVRRYRTYDDAYKAWDASGRVVSWDAYGRAPGAPLDHPGSKPHRTARGTTSGRDRRDARPLSVAPAAGVTTPAQPAARPTAEPPSDPAALAAKIVPLLRRGSLTYDDVAEKLGTDLDGAARALHAAVDSGAAIAYRDGAWHLETSQPTGTQEGHDVILTTEPNGRLTIGACGDMHLCSKYERLDCLNDYYDQVHKRGIEWVLNSGNWIDGESTFNRHDIHTHGMDAQMQYLMKHYPKRDGVTTFAITGADHEGWYARREGVDVGRYAENVMRNAGREDWVDVGYAEAFITLQHSGTGASSKLLLMHPGGGSAYALSYAPQKIVEGFDGGDKPSVLLIGHYHKSGYNLIRNVHTAQTGTFCDQTLFMRQHKLAAHVGGCFITLELDPETGAVIEFAYTFRNYFNKGFYSGRWSQHGPVVQSRRVTGG